MPVSPCIDLDAVERMRLLELARQSLEHGLQHGVPPKLDTAGLGEALSTPAAVFVTLTRRGQLRGCIGSLEARDPLALAVSQAAFNAAFGDRRFAPLQRDELDSIDVEISVLSPMEPIEVSTRQDLLESLRPGVDGLMIEDRGRRSTFLPQVWQKIPNPETFFEQLLIKAGLPADHWSPTLRLHRYGTLSFP